LTEGGVQVTAFTDGGSPVRYWMMELFAGKGWALLGLSIALSLIAFSWWKARKESA
jgi:galactitol-specific phosphotransferase system IIC component